MAKTEYKFDLSTLSAADFMAYGDLTRRIVGVQGTAGLFGDGVADPDVTSVYLDLLRLAGKFADGYTLDDVPVHDMECFIKAFVDVMGRCLAGGGSASK